MILPHSDQLRLTEQLAAILSRPEYTHLVSERATFLFGKDKNAYGVAERAVRSALGSEQAPKLLHPVEVKEIIPFQGPMFLYRAYDGVDRAGTLGGWWCSRKLLKRCANAATVNGKLDHKKTIEKMLQTLYVSPQWNGGLDIARLAIPSGRRQPVITGRGDWRALLATGSVKTEADLSKLGMDADGADAQYFLPVFDTKWVCKVAHLDAKWPFAS